jgi:hypothetical protein
MQSILLGTLRMCFGTLVGADERGNWGMVRFAGVAGIEFRESWPEKFGSDKLRAYGDGDL